VVLSMRQTAQQLNELLLPADWQPGSFDLNAWAALADSCKTAGGFVHDESHQGSMSAERALALRLESIFVELLAEAGVEDPESFVESARELGWLAPLGDPFFDECVFGDGGDALTLHDRLCDFLLEVALLLLHL
jgi:hypothetical protein